MLAEKIFIFAYMQYFAASKKAALCLLGLAAFALLSCDEMDYGQAGAPQARAENIEPALEQFVEPADLRIELKKAQYFGKASEALVFMGQEWAERMSSAEDEEKLRMAASYEKAQDDLIRKFGIKGKEEFKWIQAKALPDPVNKEVFARAGVWIKQ